MSNLYSTNLEGLLPSSNSEFDWNKRTQITNETPVVDLYDGVHHLLKDDNFWKFFFGSSWIDFEVPFNVNTGGEEVFDADGNLIEGSISKYVNGIRIADFGEQPKIINGQLRIPIGMHMEEYGVLLPETDLLLHEVYRYLDRLYPDHQDYTRILTDNEIDDNLNQAAAIVDFQLNTVLMDWLSDQMEYGELSGADLQRGKDYESIKMKIRNLWNHAFRRKLFGSLQGYKWFGADMWQHITVYPVGEYLPIKPYANKDTTILYNNTSKDFQWFRGWEPTPEIDDRSINLWHPLDFKKFRMLDWTNESYDYSIVPPAEIYGTAHTTPNSLFDMYEFRLDNNTLIPDTNIDRDFIAGSKVTVDNKPAYLSIIYPESSWDYFLTLNYDSNDNLVNSLSDIQELPKSICHVIETTESYPQFLEFFCYGFVKDKGTLLEKQFYTIKDFIIEADKSAYQMNDYNNCFIPGTRFSFLDATNELIKLFSSEPNLYTKCHLALSPFQKGDFYPSIGEIFTIYPNNINAKVLRDPATYLNAYIEFYKDVISSDSFLHYNQLISTREIRKDQENQYIAGVSGFRKGWIDFDQINARPLFDDEVENLIDTINESNIAQHGIIFNIYATNTPVILMGKPEFTMGDYDADGARKVIKIKFNITDFPKIKDFWQMRVCYGQSYIDVLNEKFYQLSIIFNNSSRIDGNYYEKAQYYINFMYTRYLYYDDGVPVSGLKKDFDDLLEALESDHLSPNDPNWIKLSNSTFTAGSAFEFCNAFIVSGWSPEGVYKSVLLQDFYKKFVNECNSSPIYNISNNTYDKDAFKIKWNSIDELFKNSIKEETTLMKSQCVNSLDRTFYMNVNTSNFTDEQIAALNKVKELDISLDSMLYNQANLLEPEPADKYMTTIPTANTFLNIKEQMDGYKTFLNIIPDPIFKCYVDYEPTDVYGTGKIIDWDFGSIQLCELVEDSQDLEVLPLELGVKQDLEEHFMSSSIDLGYIGQYEYTSTLPVTTPPTYKYLDLSKDVIDINSQRNSWIRKFGWVSYNFIEQFDMSRKNIVGTPVSKYIVKIRSIINVDQDPYKITFEDEESIKRIQILSIGDYLMGKTIENDTFITSIDVDNRCLFVSRPLTVTGDFVLDYYTYLQVFPDELDHANFYDYRKNLEIKGILDKGNPFHYGFYGSEYWPHPSMAYINGPIDLKSYKEILLTKLRENSRFQTKWNEQVLQLYIADADKNSSYVLPAFFNNKGGLFYELNAYQVYYENDKEYLCTVDMLDHFTNAVNMLSKASDETNVGFNITAETDNSGRWTFVDDSDYTDDHIHNKFAALVWNKDTLPCYYEIGTGQLPVFGDNADEEEVKQEEYYLDKSYWNYDVYAGSDWSKSDVNRTVYKLNGVPFTKVDSSFPKEDGGVYSDSYTRIDLPQDFIIPPDIKDFYIVFNGIKYGVSGSGDHYITTDLITTASGTGGSVIFTPVTGNQNIYIGIEDNQVLEPKEYEIISEGPGLYSQAVIKIKEPTINFYKHIDQPIFGGTLGEHEVHRGEIFPSSNDPDGDYTSIQFSTIRYNKKYNKLIDLNVLSEKFFKFELLQTAKSSKVILTSYIPLLNGQPTSTKSDINKIEYISEWIPQLTQDAYGHYLIKYPDSIINNNYWFINNDLLLSNIWDGSSTYDQQFNKGTILFRENNSWQIYNLVFAGLLGSSSILSDNFVIPPPEEETISISNSFPPDKSISPSMGDIYGLNQGCFTIKYVILIKLIAGLSVLRGNLNNLTSFSIRELTEIYDWIANQLSDADPAKVAAYSQEKYGVSYTLDQMIEARIDQDYDSNIPAGTHNIKKSLFYTRTAGGYSFDYWEINQKTQTNPSQFVPEITKNSIYYIMVAGSQSPDYLENGDIYAVMYNNDNFYLYKVSFNKGFILALNTKKVPAISDNNSEYKAYSGVYGKTKFSIFPQEKIESISNNIDYPDEYFKEDTSNVSIKLQFVFMTKGYKWDDYFKPDREMSDYDIMEQGIHFDKENQLFYTYNRDGLKNEKYVINIESHRYFKNCLFLIGTYQTKKEIINKVSTQRAYMNAVDGVLFESSQLSPLDRLLSFEEISLRSKYSEDLESYLFSSYSNIEGTFKGIYHNPVDGNKYILIGYKDEPGAQMITNKLNLISEINKLMPIKDDLEYTTSFCDYDTAFWPQDGSRIEWPEITEFTVKNKVSSNDGYNFKFYKNTLILEGVIDVSQMNGVDFSYNPMLGDALDYMMVGDPIVGIVGLSSSKTNKLSRAVVREHTPIESLNWVNYGGDGNIINNSSQIEEVGCKNGYMVTASDDGKVTVTKTSSITSLSDEIESFVFTIEPVNNEYGATPGKTKLTGLAWDDKTQKWILSYVSEESGSWFIEFEAETGDYKIIDENTGVDINTYQIIKIVDVDSRQNGNYTFEQDHNQYILVNARDVSTQQVDILDQTITHYDEPSDWNGNSSVASGTGSKNGIQISGNTTITTKQSIQVPKSMYAEIDFEIQKKDPDGAGCIDIKAIAANTTLTLYLYDRNLMNWVKKGNGVTGYTEDGIFVSNFRIKNNTRVQAFLVSSSFINLDQTPPVQPNVPVPPKCPMWPVPKYNGEPLFTKDSYVYGMNGNPLVWDFEMKNTGSQQNPKWEYVLDDSGRKTFRTDTGFTIELTPENLETYEYLKMKEFRNFVHFGDPGQELDNSYPPDRRAYAGGSLPYMMTANHNTGWAKSTDNTNNFSNQDIANYDPTYNKETSVSWLRWAAGTYQGLTIANDGSYSLPQSVPPLLIPHYLSEDSPYGKPLDTSQNVPMTNMPTERYPYITINDIATYCQNNNIPEAQRIYYSEDKTGKKTIVSRESDYIKYAPNFTDKVNIDDLYYDRYGWHIEILKDANEVIQTKKIAVASKVQLNANDLHLEDENYTYTPTGEREPTGGQSTSNTNETKSITLNIQQIEVPLLCLKPNFDDSNVQEWGAKFFTELYYDVQIYGANNNVTRTLNYSYSAGDGVFPGQYSGSEPSIDEYIQNTFILKTPDCIGQIQGNGAPNWEKTGDIFGLRNSSADPIVTEGIVTINNFYDIDETKYYYNTVFGDVEDKYRSYIPYTLYCILPDHMLTNTHKLFIDYITNPNEKIYFDPSVIHPRYLTNYDVPRFWPRFEVPIDYQSDYLYSDDWVREVYIYTEEYQQYVTQYNTFISGNTFGKYIKDLQDYWGYFGSQKYNVSFNSGSTPDYFSNGWDPNQHDQEGTDFRYTLINPFTQANPLTMLFTKLPQLVQVPNMLKKLPMPYSSNNVQTVAIVSSQSDPNVQAFVSIEVKSSGGLYNIVDFLTKTVPMINTQVGPFASIIEGTYNPFSSNYYIENLQNKLKSAKFVRTNDNNIEIRIYGDKLFVYSPTKTWEYNETLVQVPQVDNSLSIQPNQGWSFGKLSQNYHWKMAQLPNRRHSEVKTFQEFSPTEAYNYVYELYLTTKIALSKMIESTTENTEGADIDDSSTGASLTFYLNWLDDYDTSTSSYVHAPLKFESEEMIPVYLTMNDVDFQYTENGKVPIFYNHPSSKKVEYYATEYEIAHTGDIEHRQLKIDNYIQYLCDYATVILGDQRFESFFDFDNQAELHNEIKFGTEWAGCIKDVWLTNSTLGIITKYDDVLTISVDKLYCRDDIEDFNNWTVTQIDPQYLLETQSDTNYIIKTFGNGSNSDNPSFTTFNMFPIEMPTKGFTLNAKAVIGENVIFAGYVQATDMVKNMVERQTKYSIYNELYPNDGWKHFDTYIDKQGQEHYKKFPIIFFSSNGGKSFQRAAIPSTGPISKIDAYTDQMTASDGSIIERNSISNIEAYSVHRVGEEYRIWINNPDYTLKEVKDNEEFRSIANAFVPGGEDAVYALYPFIPLAYTSFTYSNGMLEYNEDIVYSQDADEIDLNIARKNIVIDNTTINISDQKSGSNNRLLIQKPFQLANSNEIKITGVTNNKIEFSGQEALTEKELLRVLVAISPSKNITNQSKYIEFNSDYIGNDGKFLVPEVTTVTSSIDADRVFSYREALTPTARETDQEGILSISEDLEKGVRKFYKYYDPFIDNGKEVYNYKEMTNSYGGPVVFCNDKQDYLAELDSENVHNSFSLWSLIDTQTDVNMLPKAAQIVDDLDLTTNNVDLTEYMNNIYNFNVVKAFDIGKEDPKVMIRTSNSGIERLEEKLAAEYLYKWPMEGNNPITDYNQLKSEIFESSGTPPVPNYSKPTQFGEAILYITNYNEEYATYLGEYINLINELLFNCVRPSEKINGKCYVINNLTDCLMMRKDLILGIKSFMPYIFKQGYQQFINEKFKLTSEDLLESPDEKYPITGVYLNPLGYGGSITNTSWDTIQPWEIDYVAFKNKIQRSTDNRDIYITDPYNTPIISKKGFFRYKPENDGDLLVTYDNMYADAITIKTWPISEQGYDIMNIGPSTDYNIYRIDTTPYSCWTPHDYIYFDAEPHLEQFETGDFNNPTDLDNPGPYYVPPIIPLGASYDRSTMLSILIIMKNGVPIIKPWVTYFYDGDGNVIDWLYYYNEKIWYLYNDGDDLNIISIPGSEITIKLIDPDGNTFEKTFEVKKGHSIIKDEDGNEYNKLTLGPKILASEALKMINDAPIISKMKMYYDYRTLTNDDNYNDVYVDISNDTVYVNFLLDKTTNSVEITLVTAMETLTLSGITLYNQYIKGAKLYLNRYWYMDDVDVNNILYEIYAGDQDVKSYFSQCSFNSEKGTLETLAPVYLAAEINEVDMIYGMDWTTSLPKFILFRKEEIILPHDSCLISGVYGRILMRVPNYENMKHLIEQKQQVITYNPPRILFKYNGSDFNKIVSIDKNYGWVQLEDLIHKYDYTGTDLYSNYNDNQPHTVRIKIMPLNNIILPISIMNDLDYVEEISYKESLMFSYDRYHHNSSSYPMYPFEVKGTEFNNENTKYYNQSKLVNSLGLPIYACDETGKYIKYGKDNNGWTQIILGDQYGSLANDIYGNIDTRYQPVMQVYASNIDWLLKEFYVEGADCNPFWQWVILKQNYNTYTKNNEPIYSFFQDVKRNGILVKEPVPSEDLYSRIIFNSYVINRGLPKESNIIKSFLLGPPAFKYSQLLTINLYGIEINNYLYPSEIYRDLYAFKISIDNCPIEVSYTINSTENTINIKDSDAAIQRITEMGLFDKGHNLVAYMTHPIVEYRSDKQHISYTLLVRNAKIN